MNEQVLAVSRAVIERCLQQGFFRPTGPELMDLIAAHAVFLDRPAAEADPAFKQIIPYVAVTHRGRFLLYRRTARQGEARLHDKLSLGFGGHINPVDGEDPAKTNLILAAMVRELNEELYLPCVAGLRVAGFINDDSNPVGQVHLGVAFVVEAAAARFAVNEPDKIEADWSDAAGIEAGLDRLESWSRLLWGEELRPVAAGGDGTTPPAAGVSVAA